MRKVRISRPRAARSLVLGVAAAGMLLGNGPAKAAIAGTGAAPGKPVTAAPSTGFDAFYRSRGNRPLWLDPKAGNAAKDLIALLRSASLDGLDPARYRPDALEALVAAARPTDPASMIRADAALSMAFTDYVGDQRRAAARGEGVTYVDPSLRPAPPTPLALLLRAQAAPSLDGYVKSMSWMHPIYIGLRAALADPALTADRRAQLTLNLDRARALPPASGRYIIVNAAQQRLFAYDDAKVAETMRVVVGKTKHQTPMLAAYVRYAALNPYWYVPADLAAEDVGQYVAKSGLKYLDTYGYEVVDSLEPDAHVLDPAKVDWKGVNSGKVQVLIRQKPGPKNFMGRMKFMFPNAFGVYLHDNPRRELFEKAERFYSGGCVRLEDASRLGQWLFGHPLDWQAAGTEQQVPLARPVPVYITYLTAVPDETGTGIAYFDDAYGRDAAKTVDAQTPAGEGAGAGAAKVVAER
ncbi:L,D-transpeptidase family protein [Sphingomonas sp. ASV193]|uniref:L,D-transpeptidase family protein n=1 Tax=Sphingomonas sp. ASV193 TaxID=3144405 RepID=UPI0032E904F7